MPSLFTRFLVKVFVPDRVNVAGPDFVKPCVPASAKLIVALLVVLGLALTSPTVAIIGEPEETANVSTLPLSDQLLPLVGPVTPKTSDPIVRAVSN